MKILSKLLTLWILLTNPKIPSQQRWFIRFRYFGWFHQLKYFWKDYIIRKPYKVIRFTGEFQAELLHAIPFAYWHYKNGTLKQTISSAFSKELYFFSPDHVEHIELIRDHEGNEDLEIPNAPHDTRLLKLKWERVPFKEHFKNNAIKIDKEPIIIANRYNTEWGQQPISYFDLDDLKQLFDGLKDRYQIIYNRPPAAKISEDNSEVLELGDEEWIKTNYPEVIYLPDLLDKYDEFTNYNHLQLATYSKCGKFISIHGGTATLASMFGGVNFIYSKQGHEHALHEFENVFPELSGCEVYPFKEKQLFLSEALKFFNK